MKMAAAVVFISQHALLSTITSSGFSGMMFRPAAQDFLRYKKDGPKNDMVVG